MAIVRACILCVLVLVPRLAVAGCSPIASAEPRVMLAGAAPDVLTITFLGHASFLIESPGAGATVPATFHVTGTASVFEGTLVIDLVAAGKTVLHQSVTASNGAPDRGTFDACF